jgi:signal transduction histidine kinase
MKSIRLSLMLYFLGLLGAALGGASLLVYQTAQTTLRDKQNATRELIETRFEQTEAEIYKQTDATLLNKANALAKQARIHSDWGSVRDRHRVIQAWLMPFHLSSGAGVLPALHTMVENNSRWVVDKYAGKFTTTTITLPSPDIGEPWTDDSHNGEYFQIERFVEAEQIVRAEPLRSSSLGDHFLPLASGYTSDELYKTEYDYLDKVIPGKTLRRVCFKVSNFRRPPAFPPRPPANGSAVPPGPRNPRPGGPGREPFPRVFLVIHYAVDTQQREAQLEPYRQQRQEELDKLDHDTADALTRHRNSLILISVLTFLAAGLGSFWMVRLGLRPVRQLSEAVSRVSTRDFRLPLEEAELPVELQPIAQRLVGALDMLKRAFAREKQATADISHELRTPLAAMLTTLDLALRKPRPVEQLREMLQECRLSAQQMNLIIERMLTLARLDAGVVMVRPQSVDVAELAERCAAVVRPLAEAQGLSLSVENQCQAPDEDGDTPSRTSTDPDKLREVVNNLLHNAVQYNRPAGRIDLIVARNNGHVEVVVRDTGIGIAPDRIQHIFERFYRIDPARNTDGLNAGLGLSIVKEYIDLLGGSIAVESTEGQGSSFRVVLPVQ